MTDQSPLHCPGPKPTQRPIWQNPMLVDQRPRQAHSSTEAPMWQIASPVDQRLCRANSPREGPMWQNPNPVDQRPNQRLASLVAQITARPEIFARQGTVVATWRRARRAQTRPLLAIGLSRRLLARAPPRRRPLCPRLVCARSENDRRVVDYIAHCKLQIEERLYSPLPTPHSYMSTNRRRGQKAFRGDRLCARAGRRILGCDLSR